MKFRLFTIVWGKQHIDWFERACVASLMGPSNAETIGSWAVVWDIVTAPEDVPVVEDIAKQLGVPVETHTPDLAGSPGVILQRELMAEMRRCGDSPLFIAPPDSIFADGSLEAIAAVGSVKGICVAVPHVRVNPAIIDGLDTFSMSPGRLVTAAFKHLHRTWVESDADRELTNTFASGVSWRRLGQGRYAVTHFLPTIYWAQFNDTDLPWWESASANSQMSQGAWDHFWPSKVVAEGRHRCIGSSDAAFIAEVTPQFNNIPPLNWKDPNEPDRYWGHAAHNVFQRNVVAIFRGEP